MKNLFVLIVPFLLMSCASFNRNRSFKNEVKLNENTVSMIEGSYLFSYSDKNSNFKASKLIRVDTTRNYNLYDFFKDYSWQRIDSINQLKKYNVVTFKIINKNHIVVSHLLNNTVFDSVLVKYNLKKNGYLYIKNKNLKIKVLPFILGGFDVNRIRLSIDNENNLIINSSKYSYAAILFVISGSSKENVSAIYKRI